MRRRTQGCNPYEKALLEQPWQAGRDGVQVKLLDKFAAKQMLDMHFPTTDGRELVFYT